MVDYTEKDVRSLSDLEHVRRYPKMYVGDTAISKIRLPKINGDIKFVEYDVSLGYMVCIREIIDNCIDIIVSTKSGTTCNIEYDPKTNEFCITDNSVGVPIGKHTQDASKHVPEVVFSTLRSGKNFNTDKFVIGMHGMGASLTNFFSQKFSVTIWRQGKKYVQHWKKGIASPPKISSVSASRTGTQIVFTLDSSYFHDFVPSEDLGKHWVSLMAIFNNQIKFKYNGETIRTKGLKDFHDDRSFYKKTEKWELLIHPTFEGDDAYEVYSVVNGIGTLFGGTHVSEFEKQLLAVTKKALKLDDTIHKANILKGLHVFLQLKDVQNISFDTQSKAHLVTENIEKHMPDIKDALTRFMSASKDTWVRWIRDQFERKAVQKQLNKRRRKDNVPVFYHAKSKEHAEIYIVEGLSAMSDLLSVRKSHQGCLPLRGKILNVSERKLSEVVKSDTIVNLIDALGIQLDGETKCFYEKIIIATDADPDGKHIQSLLINFFHHVAPELLDRIYVLHSPLYVQELKAGKRNVYYTKKEFVDSTDKSGDIRYNKGLGSLIRADWQIMVDENARKLTRVVNNDKPLSGKTIERLFNIDSSMRKKWLSTSDPIYSL